MANKNPQKGKRIALIVLGAVCAWLVYQNILSPTRQDVSTSRTTATTGSTSTSASARNGRTGENREVNQQELEAMDPTLHLDLLERSRQVKYEDGSRNIFAAYTAPPPPKPIANPIISTPAPVPSAPASPRPTISLKFYGTAVRSGTNEKKAFLTDGEEIFIGEEGSLIAKRYRIIRIGFNSIELEDTQSKQQQQLPLLEE